MDAVRDKGYGPTSALASLRLFDAPEGTGEEFLSWAGIICWHPLHWVGAGHGTACR